MTTSRTNYHAWGKRNSVGDRNQTRDALEFILVIGDDIHAVNQGGSGNPSVVGSDKTPFRGEEAVDLPILP